MMHPNNVSKMTISVLVATILIPCCIGFAFQSPRTHGQGHTRSDPSEAVFPPLHKAIEVGDDAGMKKLIREGADVNGLGPGSQTPLLFAAFRKNAGAIELLLKHGADPKAADQAGMTALHYVVYGQFCGTPQHQGVGVFRKEVEPKCLKIAKALVKAGAQVDARSPDAATPLHLAALNGSVSVASFLLSKGADVNARGLQAGVTPLHLTVSCDRRGEGGPEACRNTAELLIAKGSNLKAENGLGDTPLQMAAQTCNKDLTETILTKGDEVRDQVQRALDHVTNHLEILDKQPSQPDIGAWEAVAPRRADPMRKECEETRKLLLDAQASK